MPGEKGGDGTFMARPCFLLRRSVTHNDLHLPSTAMVIGIDELLKVADAELPKKNLGNKNNA